MQELTKCICFDCETQLMVRREAALLTAQGVPLISAKRASDKYGLGRDYEHPDGSGLCALCTQPADGEPVLTCCGSRDGEACELMWHKRCHEAVSESVGGTAASSQDGVLPCCAGWLARKAIDPKDRLSVGHTRYRKGLARPGQLPPQALPQLLPRKGTGCALFFALSGLVLLACASPIATTMVEHLRSAASSFDEPAPITSAGHSAADAASAIQAPAFQEDASQEDAANNATPSFLQKVKDFLFDPADAPPDDEPKAEEVEQVVEVVEVVEEVEVMEKVEEAEKVEKVEVDRLVGGGADGGVGGGGAPGGSEGAGRGGSGGGVGDGASGGGVGGEGGITTFLLHSVAASTYGAMVVNAFAPTAFPVVRATLFNAGQYLAFLRNRRDAAPAAAAAAAAAAALGVEQDPEFPEWIVVAERHLRFLRGLHE